MLKRRTLQSALGAVWLFDGLLQLKFPMFTGAFVQQVLLPNAQGQPAWIADSIRSVAALSMPHIALYNALFAIVQLLIGGALIANYRTRLTLVVSFVWALCVWWFGEGFGQLLTGQTLLLAGAPGAVLIYALIGVSVWPRQHQKGTAGDGVGVASISEEGQRFARWSIGTIWLLGAFLQLQSPFLSPGGLAGSLMPGFAVRLVEGNGVPWTIALALLQLGIGIGILSRKRAHVFAFASIGVSLLFWWVGQSFGEFWTGTGTDPNSGPLMILLTLCAVPTAWQALRARVNRGIMPEQGLDGRSSDIG